MIVVGEATISRLFCDEGMYLKVLVETDRLELTSIISAFEREQPIDVSSTRIMMPTVRRLARSRFLLERGAIDFVVNLMDGAVALLVSTSRKADRGRSIPTCFHEEHVNVRTHAVAEGTPPA